MYTGIQKIKIKKVIAKKNIDWKLGRYKKKLKYNTNKINNFK